MCQHLVLGPRFETVIGPGSSCISVEQEMVSGRKSHSLLSGGHSEVPQWAVSRQLLQRSRHLVWRFLLTISHLTILTSPFEWSISLF